MKTFVVLSLAGGTLLFSLWGIGTIGGNVREVDPGRFYRSAQLTGSTLDRVLRQYRIASVLNLRGARPGRPSYDSERAVCQKDGVVHDDIGMSAHTLPEPDQVAAIVADLDRLPRPILVHCESGADRTGLATTLYEAIVQGRPLDEAQADGLTWRYGHLAFTRSGQLDRFFDLYRQTRGTLSLRQWIAQDYPKVYREAGKD